MKTRTWQLSAWLAPLLLTAANVGAQVAVDANGEPFDGVEMAAGGQDFDALYSDSELDALVARIALYPDDLLAVVLPASTYPLQIVEAGRFLEALESDPALEPETDWDDSVVALLNYPEVIELLNEDLDWTWQLGEAVVDQQDDVIAAVETFRNRAYAAGNLRSDEYQEVSHDEGIIEILPVTEDVIHVPYYEPERVVIAQSVPAYHYYAEPRPVYYYPYTDTYAFRRGYFWGVTTAYSIGWSSDRLRVIHSSYRGHPYYGRRYYDRWWYRRPSISVHRSTYTTYSPAATPRHFDRGDYWRPSRHVRLRRSDQRITRSYYDQDRRSQARTQTTRRSQVLPNRDRVRSQANSTLRPGDRDQRRRVEQALARQPATRMRRPGSAPAEIRRDRRAGTEVRADRERRTVERRSVQRSRGNRPEVRRSDVRSVRREQHKPAYPAAQARDRRQQARAEPRQPVRASKSPNRERGNRGNRRKAERRPR